MSFAPEKLYSKLLPVFLLAACFVLFTADELPAQTRKSAAKSKAAAKEKQSSKDKQAPAKNKKDAKTAASTTAAKSKKPTKAELVKQAAERREAAKREAERRQAILEEKRRREALARAARQRQLEFERGLRNETLANIANDNIEGEDLEVRRAAVSALAGHAGTIVVLEPQTGKVLSIVNQEWAIRKGFKPCSTIKLVTGVAGVSDSAISEDGNIRSRSFPMDLDDALAHSNNSYFQKVGTNLGSSRMISYAKTLGLGEATGINAANEYAGRLPYGNNNPRIYSHGDDFEVTPLQLAVLVSEISNGGKKIIPQIPRTSVEKANFRGAMRGEIGLPKENLRRVLPGMIGAVNYGTARRSNAAEFGAAGKTGSCIDDGTWVGLFASVAPVVNPKLAVVVITRGSNERGKYASAIAGKIYQALGSRFRENGRQDLVAKQLPLELKPHPKVNAKTSALVDSDEGEDSDEGDDNPTVVKKSNAKKGNDDLTQTSKTTEKPPVKAPAKSTTKPVQLFPSVVIPVKTDHTRPRVVPMSSNK